MIVFSHAFVPLRAERRIPALPALKMLETLALPCDERVFPTAVVISESFFEESEIVLTDLLLIVL